MPGVYAYSISWPSGASVRVIVPLLFVAMTRDCSNARIVLPFRRLLWIVNVCGAPPFGWKRSYM
ncbi:MAG: hypothetical protein BWY59_00517 [Verrucomicrobia bacterium ADurb.Bin345]|nr:MAG: hypothetical protein BWY59_00517 [Verrucomicrobia bacterium ADurb.Bin345]